MRTASLSFLLTLIVLALALFMHGPVAAQTTLGETLKDIPVASHWIYDDFTKALAESQSSGKPLMVVVRCVPCPPGRTLDQQIMQPDEALKKIEDQFVCVRIIQTNGLDLKLFQYDYDMSWSAMFFSPDLNIYGRYGIRNATGSGSDSHLSQAGFLKAAERALELHKRYPEIKQSLAQKTGKTSEYNVPEEIPGLQDRPHRASSRQNCIHCHMIRENILRSKWEQGKLTAADLRVYPMPARIGLKMNVDDGLTVREVIADSPAAAAGIQPGDELVTAAGQPLISTADIQWVLHNSPEETRLPVTLRRSGKLVDKQVVLSGDWKQSDIAWRASSWFGMRQGLMLVPLSSAEKRKRNIDQQDLAMAVKGMYGKGAPKLQAAGLRKEDVIVAIDGKTKEMSESDFLIYLRLAHGPKESVKFALLRGESRLELEVPMW